MAQTRKVVNYKNTRKSKNGEGNMRLDPKTYAELDAFCKERNLNKTHYTRQAVIDQMERDKAAEIAQVNSMTPEELKMRFDSLPDEMKRMIIYCNK